MRLLTMWMMGFAFGGGASPLCGEDDWMTLDVSWSDDGTIAVGAVPEGASLVVDWGVYDGLGRADVKGAADEPVAGRVAPVDLDRWVELAGVRREGRLALSPWVRAVDADGRVVAERKLPPRPFEVVEGELVAVVAEAHPLPPEVEALLPAKARGRLATKVAVASRLPEPPPAPLLDNSDLDFDATGEPAARHNGDLLREPPSAEEVRAWLRAAGAEERWEEVYQGMEEAYQRKLEAAAQQEVR